MKIVTQKRLLKFVILVTVVLSFNGIAESTPICTFSGEVTTAGLHGKWADLTNIAVGDPFSLTLAYSYQPIPDSSSSPNLGTYHSPGSHFLHYRFDFNGFIVDNGPGPNEAVIIENGNQDSFGVYDFQGGTSVSPADWAGADDVFFNFYDSTGTAFDDDSLPSVFDPGLFDSAAFGIDLDYDLLGTFWGKLAGTIDISSATAAPVPEPATFFLLGIGLTCIAAFKKSYKN